MQLIKPLASSILFICSSLFFQQDAYALKHKPTFLRTIPHKYNEVSYFKDCSQSQLFGNPVGVHKHELRTLLAPKAIYQGVPLHCVKKRDASVNFFLTTKGFGLSFRILK